MQPEARRSSWQALLAAPKISPLFGSPFVDAVALQLDWLHVVDIGICLQFLGSIFKYFVSKIPGSIEEQTRELFKLTVDVYNSNDCQSRLDELKPSMVKDPKKPFPKLRAKAGEARELVPFSLLLIEALKENDIEQSMYQCAFHFNQCYTLLSNASSDAVALSDHGASFSALYVALHEYFDASGVHLFKITPKLHLFCEMCFTGASNPSCHWTYRDEDFGGKVAALAARKGGANTPHALAINFFQRFTSAHKVPDMRAV